MVRTCPIRDSVSLTDTPLGFRPQPDDNTLIMLTRNRPAIGLILAASTLLAGCNLQPKGVGARQDAAAQAQAQARAQAQAHADRGKHLKKEGYTAQALSAFNQAVDENPALTEAYLGIGDIYREKADYQLAERAYRSAVISDRNNFDARYFLGLNSQLQGKLPEAIASYERALRIQPNSYLANREMGSAVLQSGKPAESIKFAKRAVELNPDSQPAWANLAAAYSLTGDYRSAVDAYRQTLELGDAQEPVLIGLADAHIKLGNYKRAENALLAMQRKADSPLARERMGLVLFKQRRYEEAVASYGAALSQNAKDTAALNGMGVSKMAIFLRDGEEDEAMRIEALGLWRRSLAIRPEQRFLIDLISRYTEE